MVTYYGDTVVGSASIINVSAEEKGWICRLDNIDLAEVEDLMEEDEYMEYLETLQD